MCLNRLIQPTAGASKVPLNEGGGAEGFTSTQSGRRWLMRCGTGTQPAFQPGSFAILVSALDPNVQRDHARGEVVHVDVAEAGVL